MPVQTKTLKIKLTPDSKAKHAFEETMRVFGQACNYISGIAYEHRCYNKVALHHLSYYSTREKFELPAQLTCCVRDKVAEAYKASQTKRKRSFGRYTPVRLDARTFGVLKDGETASLSSVRGRVHARMVLGDWQRSVLREWEINGAAELVYQKDSDTWYVHVVVRRDDEPPEPSGRVVGVDIGMMNLATSSIGHKFSGRYAQHIRRHHRNIRSAIQSKGTASARRTLKRLQGKERRQTAAINHEISRRIVDDLNPGDTLVLEKLTHIRERASQRRTQRADFHSWSFGQLQEFLDYKARHMGCYVGYVDPAYTSQECSLCGERGQRQGHRFLCSSCGHDAHADFNSCFNLVRRAKQQFAPPDGRSSTRPEVTPEVAKAQASNCATA
ncbi:MAG: RNA-guided endonuclease InsQ/TnpB family protein [Salinibacter sp.]